MGYPPLIGRLHTRYSPVRRSPTSYCYNSLPLDLHVLSLSLAFILSQDQTLHCLFSFSSISLARIPSLYPSFDGIIPNTCTTCCLCNSFQWPLRLYSPYLRVQNYYLFTSHSKLFCLFFFKLCEVFFNLSSHPSTNFMNVNIIQGMPLSNEILHHFPLDYGPTSQLVRYNQCCLDMCSKKIG